MDKQREVINMQDVHSIAAAVRAANARNVARGRRIHCGRALARMLAVATGVSGVACLCLTETSLAFGAAAIPLLAATLVLQGKR